jgi:hypothetical protein
MGNGIYDGIRTLVGRVAVSGFRILALTVSGRDVAPAEVRFTAGLNVITGPSNTGKTFIAQCLDFIFGAGTPPKDIPEAMSYDSIRVELLSIADNRAHILERGLRAGDIKYIDSRGGERILGAKHQADNEDTVSSFLLRLSGLSGKKVRTNALGETRTLSFRDLVRLIIVDEETVISSNSPIHTGNPVLKPAESSVFRMLLTGVDDSSTIAKVNPKVAKMRQEGKAEVLQILLDKTRFEIAETGVGGNVTQVRLQLEKLELLIEGFSAELSAEQEGIAEFEERRRDAWSRLRQAESRLDSLSELQKRFKLLQVQYSSDLHRLDAISEAGIRLGQMKEENCPVCGSASEHHNAEHRKAKAAPQDVAVACKAEAEKIKSLLTDLKTTLTDNDHEIQRLNDERLICEGELKATSEELKAQLQPRLQGVIQKLKESQVTRDIFRRVVELHERAEEFEELLKKAQEKTKRERADGPSLEVGSSVVELFSQDIEALLRAWHFPNLQRVTYSDIKEDVVVSGRERATHGKGVRAIIRSAFNLALLHLCKRLEKPVPGFVLIDSPLVVYREPDPEEAGFPHAVKDSFYRSVASEFQNAQVIILENDDPPEMTDLPANVIRFTGNDSGRKGFIP